MWSTEYVQQMPYHDDHRTHPVPQTHPSPRGAALPGGLRVSSARGLSSHHRPLPRQRERDRGRERESDRRGENDCALFFQTILPTVQKSKLPSLRSLSFTPLLFQPLLVSPSCMSNKRNEVPIAQVKVLCFTALILFHTHCTALFSSHFLPCH